jgi:hypothetical protein
MNFSPMERETFQLQVGDIFLAQASGSAKPVERAAIWRGKTRLFGFVRMPLFQSSLFSFFGIWQKVARLPKWLMA